MDDLINAAVAAQRQVHEAVKALGHAHDGGEGASLIEDLRGKPWGYAAPTERWDGVLYLLDTHPPRFVTCGRYGEALITHGDATLVREISREMGDTLYVLTTALRNDAPVEALTAEIRSMAEEHGRKLRGAAP